MDKERLTRELSDSFAERFPGVEFNFSQYIQDNVEEAASGVKGANSVKLFGNDLRTLEKTAYEINAVMANVPGVADLGAFDSLGQPTIDIDIDRVRAAAAIGGQAAGNLYEDGSDRNFPMVIRLAPEYRSNLEAIRRIPIGVPSPSGSGIVPIALSDVADVKLVSGPAFIYRENQHRYIPIKFSVRGRDLGSTVSEAQARIAEKVKLPGGYRIDWAGEFNDLQEALARLEIVVPVSLALIALLLFLNFGSMVDTLLAASVMPMAVVGGVLALWFTGTPFSVSAAIGFIGLFGISVMEGIIVISYFNYLVEGARSAPRRWWKRAKRGSGR
jgi:cobalt-zinc-cadmium resistance protein CzcA